MKYIIKTKRQEAYSKCNGHCAYCGEEIGIEEMHVDHILSQKDFSYFINGDFEIPKFLEHLEENDINHIDNLNPACRVCNKWKDRYSLEAFRRQLYSQIDRLNRYSSNYRIAIKYGLIKESIKPIVFYFEK